MLHVLYIQIHGILYLSVLLQLLLQHTLDAMLDRAGIMSDLKDADLKGPTEVIISTLIL